MAHQVRRVVPMPAYQLLVEFTDGTTKIYDISALFQRFPNFKKLQDSDVFGEVSVNDGGTGIAWHDTLNLSGNELWNHGVTQL